jgi:hypothetical protein
MTRLLFAQDAWVFVRDAQKVSMSSDLKDLEKARKYLAKFGPGYLWFRDAGKEYVVRDGAILNQVREVVNDEDSTALRDAQLDAQDQELERHQQRLDKSEAEIEEWEDGAAPSELHDAKERLRRAQQDVNRAQEKLAKEQERLGRIEEQRSREMERRMAALIASALREGKAQQVK